MNVNHKSNGGPNVEAGSSASEGFGTMAIEKHAETASSAVAAAAQALVQARFIVAMKNPRDMDAVRLRLLKECRRPGFADVARYHKPIGKGVEGPSIRFAETAVRCMGNIDTNTQAIFDSPERRIVRVTVADLESNVAYAQDITIEKTVERSRVPNGETPLGARTNSKGFTTYILAATDDDILNKSNALISKAVRTLALRLVPGDIQDEAMEVVVATQRNRDAQDPDAARRKLFDAFAGINVKPADIKAYLGHDVNTLTPEELTHMRALFAAIRDGEASWREAFEKRHGAADGKPVEGLKERVRTKAGKAPPPPPPQPVAPPASPRVAAREPGDDDEDFVSDDYAGDTEAGAA